MRHSLVFQQDLYDDNARKILRKSSSIECPSDRRSFYQHFKSSIERNNEEFILFNFPNEEFGENTKNNLWIEILANLDERAVIDEEIFMATKRSLIPAFIEKVCNFEASVDQGTTPDRLDSAIASSPLDLSVSSGNSLKNSKLDEIIYIFFKRFRPKEQIFFSEYLQMMSLIESLLQEADYFMSLYPSFRLFSISNDLIEDPTFATRLQNLQVWHNICFCLIEATRDCFQRFLPENILDYRSQTTVEVSQTSDIFSTYSNMLKRKISLNVQSVRTRIPSLISTIDTTFLSSEDSFLQNSPLETESTASPLYSWNNDFESEDFDWNLIYKPFIERTLRTSTFAVLNATLEQMVIPSIRKACSTFKAKKERQRVGFYLDECLLDQSSHEVVCPGCSTFSRCPLLADFFRMNLPPVTLNITFLAQIPLDIIFGALKIKYDNRLPTNISMLSIKQVIREWKEVLILTLRWRANFISIIYAIGEAEAKEKLEPYDVLYSNFFSSYLQYVHVWFKNLQKICTVSSTVQSSFEAEWDFVKTVYAKFGSSDVSQSVLLFAKLGSRYLTSVSEFIEKSILELVNNEISQSPIELSRKESPSSVPQTRKKLILINHCRRIRSCMLEAKDRSLNGVSLLKAIRKSIEIAVDFDITSGIDEFYWRLVELSHVLVDYGVESNISIIAPIGVVLSGDQLDRLVKALALQLEVSQEETSSRLESNYILVLKSDEKMRRSWKGPSIKIIISEFIIKNIISLEVYSLMLVVSSTADLSLQKNHFLDMIGNCVKLVNHQSTLLTAENDKFYGELKSTAIDLSETISEFIRSVMESDGERDLFKETIQQCFNFGFEYYTEMMKHISCVNKLRLYEGMDRLARLWVLFVTRCYDRGNGRQPIWAKHGLDFMLLAYNKNVMALLDDESYLDVKQLMTRCWGHIIGCPNVPQRKKYITFRPSLAHVGKKSIMESFCGVDQVNLEQLSKAERIVYCCRLIDHHRDSQLRRKGIIGTCQTGKSIKIDKKRTKFKWNRGILLGEGNFGKVYTVQNIKTGDIMAMKEIPISTTQQEIEMLADEITILEGLSHENLVQYYGIETHHECLLIFMEYCNEGTLADVAREGLEEPDIRNFTRQIISGLGFLHRHFIIHRDVKGANIFLTGGNRVKLGDFGCSTRLRDMSTMSGEVTKMVGTICFMAPEIITCDTTGYGRSADIWSAACVVVEMATGKRPWHNVPNSYQIMFKVGMGNSPPLPDSLSDEGKDFLRVCFAIDPTLRWSADELMDHPFLLSPIDDQMGK